MHKQRLVLIVLAALGILATFLPWLNTPVGSISGTKGSGFVTAVLFLPALILSLMGDRTQPLSFGKTLAAAITTFFAIFVAIVNIPSESDYQKLGAAGRQLLEKTSVGMGIYLVIIVSLALPIAAFVLRRQTSPRTVV